MKLKPLGDRVLVKRADTANEKSAGGIIIPDTAKEKPQRGTIVAAGPGSLKDDGTRAALDVSTGDEVLFSKYAGTEVKIEGEELLIMREDDIVGILG